MDVEGTDGASSEDNQVVFNSSIVIVASINNSPLELCAKNNPICLSVFKAAYYQHVGEPSWLISGREYASPEDYFRGISCLVRQFGPAVSDIVDSVPGLIICGYLASIRGPESSSSFKPTVVVPTLQILLKQSWQTLRECGAARRSHRS